MRSGRFVATVRIRARSGPASGGTLHRDVNDPCHDHTVVDGLDASWDYLLTCAHGLDESSGDRSKSRPPPIMEPLAAAAANSVLRRFYPFLSHHLLRFSILPFPAAGDQGTDAIAPACIGLAGNPDR